MPASRSPARRGQHQALPRRATARQFGANATGDPLYQAVSDGRRLAGMEHWLPLFEEKLATLFDHLGEHDVIVRDAGTDGALEGRARGDRGLFRQSRAGDGRRAGQLPPARARARSICRRRNGEAAVAERPIHLASPFPEPESDTGHRLRRRRAARLRARARAERQCLRSRRQARRQASERQEEDRAGELHRRRARAACRACSRIMASSSLKLADSWQEALGAKTDAALLVLPLDHGFTAPDVAVLTEQDMLGDRLVRRKKRRKSADAFLAELAALTPGRPRRPRRPWHRPLRGADLDHGRQGAARLRRAELCRRRQALRAGREYRRADALRQRRRRARRSTGWAARRGSGASRG